MINQIQLVLKPGIRDNKAERIIRDARNYLGIYTGKVMATRLFNIDYDLQAAQVLEFAEKGLKDSILHDTYINKLYQDNTFSSYVLVAKLPGVTDDEGISAQKTLADLFDLHFRDIDYFRFYGSILKVVDQFIAQKFLCHFLQLLSR